MKRIIPKVALGGQVLRFFSVLCAIFISAFLQAGELSEQDVRAAVETWVRHVTADARPEAFIVKMEPHVVDGKTVAYIAHLFREGFCLCGADNLVLPVYLYNPRGIYDPENPDCQYILWEIATRTKKLTEAIREGEPEAQPYQKALSDRAELWQNLISGIAPERIEKERNLLSEPDSMSLGLTAQWDQSSPYNDQCPELTPGADEHTLVGCIATAMSQIMYYWKWPNSGVGTGSTVYWYRWRTNWDEEPLTNDPGIPPDWAGRLEWTATAGGRLRMNGYWDYSLYYAARGINDDPDYLNAFENLWNRMTPASTNCGVNFGAANYNWSIIADIHTDPPDPGDAEVAELCYHAGVSVETGYGIWGSGSYTPLVADALEDHFHYDPDAVGEDRNISTMTEEILWLRPLEISGCDADTIGCHAWVVYGYNKATDPDRQFLMNMGWGPWWSHVWYSCDNVFFPILQYHVTRIAPEDVVKFVGNNSSGNGSPGNPYKGIEEAVVLAPDDATLIFKAGSINTFSAGTLVINRPLTLKGVDVVIQKQ